MILSKPADEVYDNLDFKTNAFYNRQPPDPWVSFLLAGIFVVATFVLWINRYIHMMAQARDNSSIPSPVKMTVRIRAALACYADNDHELYTLFRTAAQSFLILGGLQLDYKLTFLILVSVFAVEATAPVICVLLAIREAGKTGEVTCLKAHRRRDAKSRHHEVDGHEVFKFRPKSIYADYARSDLIIGMIFLSQCALTTIVAVDIFRSSKVACIDGTEGCPVVGTAGSYLCFVFGIVVTCVYLVGPNSNWGESEQDPDSWLFLFRMAQRGMECTYKNPIRAGRELTETMSFSSLGLWGRFIMNYLVNGVAFRILIHALAIQMASQSSLLIIVFRVTGMVFIANMDDAKGDEMEFRAPNNGNGVGASHGTAEKDADSDSAGSV